MQMEPQAQHRWLDRMLGRWASESECQMGPDGPTARSEGVEVVRSLGGLWVVGEGEGDTPEGKKANWIMTLGFDPAANHFVGTFIASMMTHMWLYRGTLDKAERVLTLETEGPDFTTGKMMKYRDVIEFLDDDHRTMTSEGLGADGQWTRFMLAHYRRKG